MKRKVLSFKGGIHPTYNKELTKEKEIEKVEAPSIMEIPLVQHIGAPAQPLVKAGDFVKMGQLIGACAGAVSANVHASVSGEVLSVEPKMQTAGMVSTVVIENDGKDERDSGIQGIVSIDKLTTDEIINLIKDAGIVGMGGATFPTHVKLNPPKEHLIDTLIINGAECEPYLTSDYRVMVETPEDIVNGGRVLIKVLGIRKAYIGIEDNKPKAIRAIEQIIQNDETMEVAVLKTKYPQGGEKQLIKAVTSREVPSGKLPSSIGCVVINAGTVAAICKALISGMPLIERVVTVTGVGIKNPKNLLVRLGTPIRQVIEQCGGLAPDCKKLISGGPMMGIAQYTLDNSVTKGTSGILAVMESDDISENESSCIKCARCMDACPMGLMPLKIMQGIKGGHEDEAMEFNVMDCIECGCCSFICPAKRPILQYIRTGKAKMRLKRN